MGAQQRVAARQITHGIPPTPRKKHHRREPRTREGVLVQTAVPATGSDASALGTKLHERGKVDRPLMRVSETITRLHGAGSIGAREVQAAGWLRTTIESVECYGTRAIDYAADKVDGSMASHLRNAAPWNVIDAMETIKEVQTEVGTVAYGWLRAIVYEDRTVASLAALRPARDRIIGQVVQALGKIADRWCRSLDPRQTRC